MFSYVYLFFGAYLATVVAILATRYICLRKGIFLSSKGIYSAAAISFVPVLFLSYIIFIAMTSRFMPTALKYLLLFSFIVFIFEIFDDLKELSLLPRVAIQSIVIVAFLFYSKFIQIYFFPQWINYLLSFFWIMGITNAFNLLDIGDGLSAGVSLIISVAFLIIVCLSGQGVLIGLFVALCAVLMGFLVFNAPDAKAYMGNCGSHFLGFFFATVSMYIDYASIDNPLALLAPVLILAFPIIDTIFLIIARIKKGIVPLRKSNDHIFMRLCALGYSKVKALSIICLATTLWALSAIFVVFTWQWMFFVSLTLAFIATGVIVAKAHRARLFVT